MHQLKATLERLCEMHHNSCNDNGDRELKYGDEKVAMFVSSVKIHLLLPLISTFVDTSERETDGRANAGTMPTEGDHNTCNHQCRVSLTKQRQNWILSDSTDNFYPTNTSMAASTITFTLDAIKVSKYTRNAKT